MKILLVEDEPDLAYALAAALRHDQFVVDTASSLREAEEMALAGTHDVIVLDRGLPDGDGLSLVATLRHAGVVAGVLVLTAMSAVAERVRSLDGGADDYLAKPFAVDELMARLRALRRRPAVRAQDITTVGLMRFDHGLREAQVRRHTLVLPRRELLVLETLVQHKGRTVQRALLQERVYGDAESLHSNALDAHVSRLRTKLERAGAEVEIHAIRGVGYLLRAAAAG